MRCVGGGGDLDRWVSEVGGERAGDLVAARVEVGYPARLGRVSSGGGAGLGEG